MRPYLEDTMTVNRAMNNRMTPEPMEDHQGHKMWHMKMTMPMIMSNRSLIACIYQADMADGWKAVFTSSQGNEAQTAAHAEAIGSDVIANNIINFVAYKPYDGGMELKSVLAMDPAGSIPGFIKSKMGGRMANQLILLTDYLKNGAVPEAMF